MVKQIGRLTSKAVRKAEASLFWTIIGWGALILLGWAAYVFFISAFLRSFINAV